MKRFAVLAAATILTCAVAGCSTEQAPVPEKVQQYYDEHVANRSPVSASASAAPVADGMLGTIQSAVQSGTGPLVISVLGDSTGNAPGEWVDLWGKHLAKYGTVTIHQWDQAKETWSTNDLTYTGGARKIEIWNGSMSGAKSEYPASRIAAIQPVEPSFLILSFGHNGDPAGTTRGLEATYTAITDQWKKDIPAAVILQNPAGPPRTTQTDANQREVSAWAYTSGLPTVNVRAEFEKAPDLQALLLADGLGVHPNDAGQRIWADVVRAELG